MRLVSNVRFLFLPSLSAALLAGVALFSVGCATPNPDPACSGAGIQNIELLRSTETWDGKKLPPHPRTQPEISIRKIIIPPGEQLPVHLHPVINAGVLLRGELEVVKEGGPVKKLRAGDALIELVNAWHYGRNPGTIPAEIIVVYAGTPGVPTTVLKNPPAKP